MELIDKASVVEEIKRKRKIVEKRLYNNNSYSEEANTAWERDEAVYDAYVSLLYFIDNLEIKEVD